MTIFLKIKLKLEFSRRNNLALVQGGMYIDEISLIKVPDIPSTTTTSSTTSTTIQVETPEPITDISFSPDWITHDELISTSKTSTLSPITVTPITPVFNCNFDQTNAINTVCGGINYQLVTGSVPAYGVLNNDPIYFGTLLSHVTDIKSISTNISIKINIYFN